MFGSISVLAVKVIVILVKLFESAGSKRIEEAVMNLRPPETTLETSEEDINYTRNE